MNNYNIVCKNSPSEIIPVKVGRTQDSQLHVRLHKKSERLTVAIKQLVNKVRARSLYTVYLDQRGVAAPLLSTYSSARYAVSLESSSNAAPVSTKYTIANHAAVLSATADCAILKYASTTANQMTLNTCNASAITVEYKKLFEIDDKTLAACDALTLNELDLVVTSS